MAIRVEGVGDDAREVNVIGNVGGVVRDTDYQMAGVKVRDGIGSRTVTSPDQLRGDELITVQGMELTVNQAKELGLIGKVFDESLSTGALVKAATEAQQAKVADEPAKQETGISDYDQAVARLEAEIDNGTLTLEEAKEYDTALARVAMQGLSVDQVVETIDGLASGTVDQTEVPGEVKSMIHDVETSVENAAIASAKSEIGGEGFAELQRAAAASPEVNEAIRGFAIRRATGRSEGLTWADLLQDVRDYLAGRA